MFVAVVILAIFGLAPTAFGIFFLSLHVRNLRRAALISRVPTSPAAAVAGMRPGQLVEVKGTLRCPKPLKSELAGRPCAYFESRLDRIFRQEVRDSDGDTRTEERTEAVATNVRLTPFFVEDATGRVRVVPNGAELDGLGVYDQFEERPGRGKGRISLGGRMVEIDYGFDTLGYRLREEILPIDDFVYVVGVVGSDGSIARPAKGQPGGGFLISYRSEESLVRSFQMDPMIFWPGVGGLAVGGLFFASALLVWLIWG
jgi:hypothetical protein